MIELAALDIAGTTIEEHQAVYRALAEAVGTGGATPGSADVHRWMGADKREAITALLGGAASPDLVDKTFDEFRRLLRAAYAETPPVPLPGVPEALARLRAAGVKVVLTTGFDREVTGTLLAGVGWDDSVLDGVVCVDEVRAGRPAPYMIFRAMEIAGVRDVRRVLTAGDTVRDLEAGTNAGAGLVVGVLSGAQSATDLGVRRHTHLLPGVAAIPDLLGLGFDLPIAGGGKAGL